MGNFRNKRQRALDKIRVSHKPTQEDKDKKLGYDSCIVIPCVNPRISNYNLFCLEHSHSKKKVELQK